MRILSWRFLTIIGVFLILATIVIVAAQSYQKRTRTPQVIENTLSGSFSQYGYRQQWPLTIIDDRPDSYLVRVVIEPQVILGEAAYGDSIALAWNQGYVTDKTGKVAKVAIPRVWYKPDFKQLYFLGTTSITDATDFPGSLFLQGSLDYIDSLHTGYQPIVGAYIDPTDDAIPGVSEFFTTPDNRNWLLPESFILTGSVKDLPTAPNMGVFLPATNVSFDINH